MTFETECTVRFLPCTNAPLTLFLHFTLFSLLPSLSACSPIPLSPYSPLPLFPAPPQQTEVHCILFLRCCYDRLVYRYLEALVDMQRRLAKNTLSIFHKRLALPPAAAAFVERDSNAFFAVFSGRVEKADRLFHRQRFVLDNIRAFIASTPLQIVPHAVNPLVVEQGGVSGCLPSLWAAARTLLALRADFNELKASPITRVLEDVDTCFTVLVETYEAEAGDHTGREGKGGTTKAAGVAVGGATLDITHAKSLSAADRVVATRARERNVYYRLFPPSHAQNLRRRRTRGSSSSSNKGGAMGGGGGRRGTAGNTSGGTGGDSASLSSSSSLLSSSSSKSRSASVQSNASKVGRPFVALRGWFGRTRRSSTVTSTAMRTAAAGGAREREREEDTMTAIEMADTMRQRGDITDDEYETICRADVVAAREFQNSSMEEVAFQVSSTPRGSPIPCPMGQAKELLRRGILTEEEYTIVLESDNTYKNVRLSPLSRNYRKSHTEGATGAKGGAERAEGGAEDGGREGDQEREEGWEGRRRSAASELTTTLEGKYDNYVSPVTRTSRTSQISRTSAEGDGDDGDDGSNGDVSVPSQTPPPPPPRPLMVGTQPDSAPATPILSLRRSCSDGVITPGSGTHASSRAAVGSLMARRNLSSRRSCFMDAHAVNAALGVGQSVFGKDGVGNRNKVFRRMVAAIDREGKEGKGGKGGGGMRRNEGKEGKEGKDEGREGGMEEEEEEEEDEEEEGDEGEGGDLKNIVGLSPYAKVAAMAFRSHMEQRRDEWVWNEWDWKRRARRSSSVSRGSRASRGSRGNRGGEGEGGGPSTEGKDPAGQEGGLEGEHIGGIDISKLSYEDAVKLRDALSASLDQRDQ